MEISKVLLSFRHLAGIAPLTGACGDEYETQQRLAAECRALGIPFITEVVYRSWFRCRHCGAQIGDSRISFEDPRNGASYTGDYSELHEVFVHGTGMPPELENLLRRVGA